MGRIGKLLNYYELLEKYPDWVLWETDAYYKEATEDETERSKIHRKRMMGTIVKFIQDKGLTRKIICSEAPNIPDDFRVRLSDVTPEALEFYRVGYKKWLKRFERNKDADPSDTTVLERELKKMRSG